MTRETLRLRTKKEIRKEKETFIKVESDIKKLTIRSYVVLIYSSGLI